MRIVPCRNSATALDAFMCVLCFVKCVARQSRTSIVSVANAGTFGVRGSSLASSDGFVRTRDE